MSSILPFALAPVLLLLLVAILLVVDSRMRGWHRMAGRFRATAPDPDAPRQDGTVGAVGILQLRGLIRAHATTDGLFVAAPRLIRLTHPPLLIPWEQISIRDEQRRLGVPILRLSIGRLHVGFITLRGGVAGDVLGRLAGPGPTR